ncbi:MAG: 50S ribosomal protein L13 [Dehalococcoidia bacterium]|nr:50S ribosomal protein L13 [Dehalococcoidia bacterium]
MMKTYVPKAGDIQHNWRVIDAADRPVGRVASEVAQILKGKDKPSYTPNLDTGDFVVVINASKVRTTAKKLRDKTYFTHSGYPGGLKAESFDSLLQRHPRRVIENAVWGMLPKGSLGRTLMTKLKVYGEATHPHGAQVKEAAAPMRPGRVRDNKKATVRAAAAAPSAAAESKPAEKGQSA